MELGRTEGSAIRATAVFGLAAGAVLAAAENAWFVASHELSFEDGADRALFWIGSTALEALVAAGAAAALGLVLLAAARRGGGQPSARSIAIPVVALLAFVRVLPWIDALAPEDVGKRIQLGIDVGLALAASAGALWLHRRLSRSTAGPPLRAFPVFPVAALAAAAFALALGARIVLLGGSDAPVAVAAPSPREPAAAAELVLPAGTPVILLLVDTLRADHLSYAGYERETSPNLDRLAREGVVFERAISQATRTSPSVASLITGTTPMTHGVFRSKSVLDDGLLTWGEILQEHGYATSAVLSNPNVGHHFQYTQGIDHVEELFGDHGVDASIVLSRALARLAEREPGPNFLWIHLIDPHAPYAAPGPSQDVYRGDALHAAGSDRPLPNVDSRFGGVPHTARLEGVHSLADYVARYDAEIRFADEQLGHFFEGLERLDLPAEPLIVFVSDHGESLGDHDYYFSHGRLAYDTTAHVPLVFHHSALPRGLRVSQMVRTQDVLPTVLELLGVPLPGSLEGRSLTPLLTGGRLEREPAIIFAGVSGLVEVAARDDRYKFVARPVNAGLMNDWAGLKLSLWPNERRHSPLLGPRHVFALYDLVADPDETTNLVGRIPDVQAELQAFLTDRTRVGKRELDAAREVHPPPARVLEDQLRALGYLE